MRENNIELQNRFEMQIDNSNLSADNKEYMKRIVDGIMKSPKGRLYLINDPQFQKYITFRKDMSIEEYFDKKNLAVLSSAKGNTIEDVRNFVEEICNN